MPASRKPSVLKKKNRDHRGIHWGEGRSKSLGGVAVNLWGQWGAEPEDGKAPGTHENNLHEEELGGLPGREGDGSPMTPEDSSVARVTLQEGRAGSERRVACHAQSLEGYAALSPGTADLLSDWAVHCHRLAQGHLWTTIDVCSLNVTKPFDFSLIWGKNFLLEQHTLEQ